MDKNPGCYHQEIHLKKGSFALSSDINSYKAIHAADWLVSNSNLYKDDGIAFNNELFDTWRNSQLDNFNNVVWDNQSWATKIQIAVVASQKNRFWRLRKNEVGYFFK